MWNRVSASVRLSCQILPKLPIVKKGVKWTAASEAQRRRASDHILHALCIRAAYLVAVGDPGDFFDTVAVNARQKWFDPATGRPKEGIVASLQAPKHMLCQLEPERLDPTACFRHLSGIASPNLLNAAPIRPIFVMNINDNRIVASKDVTSQLQEATNLAAMPISAAMYSATSTRFPSTLVNHSMVFARG